MEIASIKNQFYALMERIRESWHDFVNEKAEVEKQESSLEEYLGIAQKEWKDALEYFDNVTEPELVDHASFLLRAAESKYIYLLRKYKEEISGN
ncbi:DUF2508 family protein [Natronospora cellulosivora (SeqCode)]